MQVLSNGLYAASNRRDRQGFAACMPPGGLPSYDLVSNFMTEMVEAHKAEMG